MMEKIKTGKEKLLLENSNTNYSVLDFWRWSFSDLLSNTTRGIFAEFIVATALNINLSELREDWADYDLTTSNGTTIEVKSAAYIQSWEQKSLSKISFPIRQRNSDFYIFCLLKTKEENLINPLDLSQWLFYILPTKIISNIQYKSISLPSLEKLAKPVIYEDLKEAFDRKLK